MQMSVILCFLLFYPKLKPSDFYEGKSPKYDLVRSSKIYFSFLFYYVGCY